MNPASPGAEGPPALPSGWRLAGSEICHLLGRGGFGIVYLARDSYTWKTIAIKEYAPSSIVVRSQNGRLGVRTPAQEKRFRLGLQAFCQEARILVSLQHPALPTIHRFWQENDTAYLSMPYYPGPTWQQLAADRSRTLTPQHLEDCLGTLMGALQTLHENACFHRDISPDNIILDGRGSPILLDLGAATRGQVAAPDTLSLVKPSYSPLERYSPQYGQQGAWSDLYSLGAVLYHLIAGHPPPASLARNVLDTLVPLSQLGLDGYPKDTLVAIDRTLSLHYEERPQSVAELATELGMLLQGQHYRRPIAHSQRSGAPAAPITQATKSPCSCSSSTWMRARRTVGSSISSSTCFWSRSNGNR